MSNILSPYAFNAGPWNDLGGGLFGSAPSGAGAFLFQDDFSSGDFSHTENGASWVSQTYVSIQNDPDDAGNNTARFLYNPVADNSGAPFPELRFDLGAGNYYPELWIELVFRLPSPVALYTNVISPNPPVDDAGANKLLRLWAGDRASDPSNLGKAAPYIQYGSSFTANGSDGESNPYVELGTPGSVGPGYFSGAYTGTGMIIPSDSDQEIKIVHHVKVDTVSPNPTGAGDEGSGNGTIEVFRSLNGGAFSTVVSKTDIEFAPTNPSFNGFNAGYLMGADGYQFNYQSPDGSLTQAPFYLRQATFAETNIFGVS